MAMQAKKPMTGGTDAHSLGEIGNVSIIVEGNPLEAIKKGKVRVQSVSPIKFPLWHALTLMDRTLAGVKKKLK
jgi:hypothetical protein